MFEQPKVLIFASILFIIFGFGLLWFNFNPADHQSLLPQSTPFSETVQSATNSAVIYATSSAIAGIEGERVIVTDVVDGDTIKISGNRTVRFVGIDTPETVDPRRPVGCYGKEASNETKRLLTGKMIILQKDVSEKDKYNRLLRLIYLPLDDGQILFVNDYLVRMGFAKSYRYPPDLKYDAQFKQAENDAKQNSLGLWGKC